MDAGFLKADRYEIWEGTLSGHCICMGTASLGGKL